MKAFYRFLRSGLLPVLVALLVLSPLTLHSEQVSDLPRPTDYVSDLAHVLSPEAIAHIDHICSQLDHSQANAQIAVVTVKTLDGEDPADWANQLEDKWKVGKKGSDKGALILLAVQDRKYRIDVGYGLEGILPDGLVGDMGREMRLHLRAGDYDSALSGAVDQIGQAIASDAKITLQQNDQQLAPRPLRHAQHHGSPLGGIIFLIILLVIFGGSGMGRMLFGWLGWGMFFSSLGGGGPRDGWGGGRDDDDRRGGGGGGDSGFGGFGGGDFGGGGAGGDW